MNFWVWFGLFIVASAAVYGALSINGKDEPAAGGHGHDDHGHGGHH